MVYAQQKVLFINFEWIRCLQKVEKLSHGVNGVGPIKRANIPNHSPRTMVQYVADPARKSPNRDADTCVTYLRSHVSTPLCPQIASRTFRLWSASSPGPTALGTVWRLLLIVSFQFIIRSRDGATSPDCQIRREGNGQRRWLFRCDKCARWLDDCFSVQQTLLHSQGVKNC